eukprot:scaffold2205_cov167-Amphora_coffeaeformis.AAC.5
MLNTENVETMTEAAVETSVGPIVDIISDHVIGKMIEDIENKARFTISLEIPSIDPGKILNFWKDKVHGKGTRDPFRLACRIM